MRAFIIGIFKPNYNTLRRALSVWLSLGTTERTVIGCFALVDEINRFL